MRPTRHGRPTWRRRGAALGLIVASCGPLGAVGCRSRDPSCPDHLTPEECAFRKAQARAVKEAEEQRARGGGNGGAGGSGDWEGEADWARADEILQHASDMFGAGLDGQSAMASLADSCQEVPSPREGEAGRSWTCFLTHGPVLLGKEFVLEVGESGILALSAFDVSKDDSRRILQAAQLRWSRWCRDGEFVMQDPGEASEELLSCALPGGPLLVVSRFPQDLESQMWQVSLTVLGAG